MKDILIESVIIGLLTIVVGRIVMRLITKFNRLSNNDSFLDIQYLEKTNKKCYINLNLFIIGVIIHIVFEYIMFKKYDNYGMFDGWTCTKKCINDVCDAICKTRI